jgi:energy-coupling factor transporter ATP-binding protein EcfA2
MSKRIEKLGIKAFRGGCNADAPITFEFDRSKPIVLIYGENGSGKSTIADAIDFACNNEFGSLRDKSSTQPKTHVVGLGANAKQLEVTLSIDGQAWRANLVAGKPHTSGPGKPPRAHILRRADIVRIVEETPKNKYEALKGFIAITKIERVERELHDALRNAQSELDESVRALNQADEALKQLWARENAPNVDYMDWARERTAYDITTLTQRLQVANDILNGVNVATIAGEQLTSAQHDLAEKKADLDLAEQNLQQAQASQTQRNEALVSLLQETARFLNGQPTIEACPVCGKPENASGLRERVATQLAELKELAQLRNACAEAQHQVSKTEGAESKARKHFQQTAHTLAIAISNGSDVAEQLDPACINILLNTGAEEAACIQAGLKLLNDMLAIQQVLIQQRNDDQKMLNQLNALQSHLQVIDEHNKNLAGRKRLVDRLSAMQNTVSSQRKIYVQEVLDNITHRINELYSRMHPGEEVGQLNLSLKPNVAGSVEMSGQFGTLDDAPPAAYYSEAHLDTLGLCVYLALAKQSGSADSVIVLDDVLTSVDDVHLERAIQLINDEASHYGHMIITTHSRAWFDRCRFGGDANMQLMELHSWSLQTGIQHHWASTFTDELRCYLRSAPMDRQIVASKAGILLERLLNEITLQYGCRLPHLPHSDYTLGTLADAITGEKKLVKVLKIERVDAAGVVAETFMLKELIDQATTFSWVRNQVGAHFNVHGSQVLDAQVRQFAQHTLTLADTLICPACGRIPNKSKSGSYLECGGGCGRTRLYPLQMPD